jgi:hypothetical protein
VQLPEPTLGPIVLIIATEADELNVPESIPEDGELDEPGFIRAADSAVIEANTEGA